MKEGLKPRCGNGEQRGVPSSHCRQQEMGYSFEQHFCRASSPPWAVSIPAMDAARSKPEFTTVAMAPAANPIASRRTRVCCRAIRFCFKRNSPSGASALLVLLYEQWPEGNVLFHWLSAMCSDDCQQHCAVILRSYCRAVHLQR